MGQSLSNLLHGLVEPNQYDDIVVSGLATHSSQVNKDYLYLAVRGQNTHGLNFLSDAVDHGASAVVWEKTEQADFKNDSIPSVAVENLRQKTGIIADRFFNHPSQEMSVVAVTGTNGKTSIAHITGEALKIKYGSCGFAGTLGIGEFDNLKSSDHTTPDALLMHSEMRALRDKGVEHIVLEASSHGLVQHRLVGVDIDVAVFTLLGRDHFDYHGSLEEYANAKKKLFEMDCLDYAILNKEDLFSQEIAKACHNRCKVLTYSVGDARADFFAENINLTRKGSSFNVVSGNRSAKIQSNLIGRFNISCLLAAFAILIVRGVEFEEAAHLLSQVHPVRGRMQKFTEAAMPLVILDYAHTPDALEAALLACREITEGKLRCVFGCGGERDRGKRALMGRVASRLSDQIILTDDNPRNEDPGQIVTDILEGLDDFSQAKIIHNREQAILSAIESADESDCVVIAGKGHETYQQIGAEQKPMDDAESIRKTFGRIKQCRG